MSTSKSRKQAPVGNLSDQAPVTLDNAAQPDDRHVSPNPGSLIEDQQMSPSYAKRSARGKENKVSKPVKRGKRTTASATARSAKMTASRRPSATKAETIITLLKRSHGASIAELMKATRWQAHSVRGFLSATVKRRMGLALTSERADSKDRRYRIV